MHQPCSSREETPWDLPLLLALLDRYLCTDDDQAAPSLSTLELITSNDDCEPGNIGSSYSCAKVFGLAGRTYAIQVDGFGRQRGAGSLTASGVLAPAAL